MSWGALLLLAAGTYAFRAVGPLLLAGRRLPHRVDALLGLLPPALLAALVATQTFGDGQGLSLDARAAGVAAAAVAVWRGAPFLVVVLVGTVTAAALRAAGLP